MRVLIRPLLCSLDKHEILESAQYLTQVKMVYTFARHKLNFRFTIWKVVIVIGVICYISSYMYHTNFSNVFKRDVKPRVTDFPKRITAMDYKQSDTQSSVKIVVSTKPKETNNRERETVLHYNQSDVQKSTKLILLWRPMYRTVRTFTKAFEKHCPSLGCTVSSNRSLLSKADAVFVEVEAIEKFPNRGKMGQVWIYCDMEPPTYLRNGILNWNNFFNWTMSYRRDSDFILKYTSVPNMRTAWKNIDKNMVNRTKHISWIASHCRTASNREDYVKILQQHFQVDIFGRCGKNICHKDTGCEYKYVMSYKFTLAAENSNCRDYITEKIRRPLEVSTLAIVKGGSNYSLYLPPNSVIDADNFSSPVSLANHLKLVNNDDKLYKSYFAWQKHSSDTEIPGYNVFCEICRKLHTPEKYQRLYRSIHDWWRGNKDNAGEYFCNEEELVKL